MSGKAATSASESTEQYSIDREERLVEAVAEDGKIGPAERETILKFAKPDDRVSVYTEEGGLMRRLLQHPEFQLKSLRVTTDYSWGERVDPDDFDQGTIIGVDGWVPIKILTLKTSPRTTSQHAAIVSERVLRGD